MTDSNLSTAITADECNRAFSAVVALTTHADMGGAVRLRQGYYRRDWLLFAAATSDVSRRYDAELIARHLDCDLVAAELVSLDEPPLLNVGMRLWGRYLWHTGLRLWRDDLGGRCCLVSDAYHDQHLWLETGRAVAREGMPWRDMADRELGFARAAAAWRRLVRKG